MAWVRGSLRALAAVLVGLLLLELALRFCLFSETLRGTSLARRLRHAELYAPVSGRDYWKLDALFSPNASARPHPSFHAELGWLKDTIDPTTLAHADEATIAGRRPVLLFGDSFAQCVERAGACWQDLLEESDLSDRYALLNYGVGGYGLDQSAMLLGRVLTAHRDDRAIVVLAILVDDDLDRSYLALRNHPKPYYTTDQPALVAHPVEERDALGFIESHPVGIVSYLGRWILFGSGVFAPERALSWTSDADNLTAKQRLNARILGEVQHELEEAGVTYFFLLFHGKVALASLDAPFSWQEPFLYREFERLHVPFVSSKRYLRDHMRRTGAGVASFYYDAKPGQNHYTGEANAIVFQALRDGLEGRFEPYEYLPER